MKRILAIGLLSALVAAGCATQPPADQAKLASASAKADEKPFCLKDTGSRIKPKEGECRGPGTSYSKDDIDQTGAFDTAEALRRLDPRIQ
jgi:hypothetical protein